jgi:hypothetical protein
MHPLMRRITTTAVAGAAIAGGVAVARVAARRRAPATSNPRGRHSVTVFRPLEEIRENLPEELMSGDLRVELRTAPGGRGTEIHVRADDGGLSDGEIRRILRESRSVLEAGEVLAPGVPTTTPTVLNKPLRAVTRRGREGGLL